jgi:hypothetical protein
MQDNIKPYNHKGQPHGYWEGYWSKFCKCFYVNGVKFGHNKVCYKNSKLRHEHYYAK